MRQVRRTHWLDRLTEDHRAELRKEDGRAYSSELGIAGFRRSLDVDLIPINKYLDTARRSMTHMTIEERLAPHRAPHCWHSTRSEPHVVSAPGSRSCPAGA